MNKDKIKKAFQALMGVNGDNYVAEILQTGNLSAKSYFEICDNVYFNGSSSIMEHFGLVQWYYFENQRARAKS